MASPGYLEPIFLLPFLRVKGCWGSSGSTGAIGRDDFEASQGAKSAHTGSMEAMSDAGAAQKRSGTPGKPIFGPGRRCFLGHIVPLCFPVAPRPDHKSGPPNGTGYVVADPKSFTSGPEEICVFKGPFH